MSGGYGLTLAATTALAQRVEYPWCGNDDLVGAHEIHAAGEVADPASGFLHQQRAGSDVPRLEVHDPEAVEASRGEMREVKRRGPRAAHARALRGQRIERGQVCRELRALACGKCGAHQGFGQVEARRHVDLVAVVERTLALCRGEQVVVHRVEHDCVGDFGAACERHRHGVVRKPMDEVGGAVDGIDDPLVAAALARAFDVPRFLAQDRVLRKRRAQRGDDCVFGFHVGSGHDVAVLLRERGEPLQVARRVDHDAAGGTRRAGGDGEDGVVGNAHDLGPLRSSCSMSR